MRKELNILIEKLPDSQVEQLYCLMKSLVNWHNPDSAAVPHKGPLNPIFSLKTGKIVSHPIRVLILDDDELLCEALKGFLVENLAVDASITIATKGRTALEVMQYNDVHLIFIDLNLDDEMSGISVLKFIKHEYPKTVCCMISGATEAPVIVDCMKLGAVDYLTKPIDPDKIMALVKQAQRN